MNITFSIDQLEEVAQKIIAEKPNKIILSWREMGVGKTINQAIVHNTWRNWRNSSPTFLWSTNIWGR
jgi:tRNA threonylcarbamoyladenosine biosynthesis protein TsaE